MARMKVMAGVRLPMAEAKVAEVKAKLWTYKFWVNDPLHQLNAIINIRTLKH